MPDKKEASFVCINHTASPGMVSAGPSYAPQDLSAVVVAIGRLGEKLEHLRLNVWVPDPQVIEVAPIIHMPELPINVAAPIVHIPENRPIIEVRPSEVVIQRVDGQIVQTPIQPVQLELSWQIYLMAAVPTALLILDIVMRLRP